MSRWLPIALTLAALVAACVQLWLDSREPTYDRRCDGPARYEAMREAYERGRPHPCP